MGTRGTAGDAYAASASRLRRVRIPLAAAGSFPDGGVHAVPADLSHALRLEVPTLQQIWSRGRTEPPVGPGFPPRPSRIDPSAGVFRDIEESTGMDPMAPEIYAGSQLGAVGRHRERHEPVAMAPRPPPLRGTTRTQPRAASCRGSTSRRDRVRSVGRSVGRRPRMQARGCRHAALVRS